MVFFINCLNVCLYGVAQANPKLLILLTPSHQYGSPQLSGHMALKMFILISRLMWWKYYIFNQSTNIYLKLLVY